MMTEHADLTIYSSASLKSGRVGFGYLALHGTLIRIGSGALPVTVANSFRAEVEAAEAALSDAIARADGNVRSIDLIVSSGRMEEMFSSKRLWTTSPVGSRPFRVLRVAPYQRSSSGASYANAVAHNLAAIGRSGEVVDAELLFDRDWRDQVVAMDSRLDPDPRPVCLTGHQAAERLGISYEAVGEMVRTGQLPVDIRTGGIPEQVIAAMCGSRSEEMAPRLAVGA